MKFKNRCIACLVSLSLLLVIIGCNQSGPTPISPRVTTQPAIHDTDDPAIWINYESPENSLIIGTDKDEDGALYVYDLQGNIIEDKVVRGIRRPNNVDIEYGLLLNGEPVDLAVTTERYESRLRVFSLPDMQPVDNGGIPVFEGETEEDFHSPMGIALYKRPSDNAIFAIVSRKAGPTDGGYLWQYRLHDDGSGHIAGTLIRQFGLWCGEGEIEAVAVDDALGYVYYSDEPAGIRKYYADPDHPNAAEELALFGTNQFVEDREGISIYTIDDGTGYILVSDQQRNAFQVFPREGKPSNPHQHDLIKTVFVSTNESDGSDVTVTSLPPLFPNGLFVAMSNNRTFQLYGWEDIAGDDLVVAPNGSVE